MSKVSKKATKIKVEDRSAFNCVPCGGDGLVGNTLCEQCEGSGKSDGPKAAFPEGTVVLTQEGQYKVENGVLVKLEEKK